MSWDWTLLYFFISTFICFAQKEHVKEQTFILLIARMKINQIPYVILQVTSQFSYKSCITVQFHDAKFLWNFLAETYTLDKNIASKCNFSDF